MHRCRDGTDHLARRILAVHAENWLEVGVRIVHTAFVITVDAQPVHYPAKRKPGVTPHPASAPAPITEMHRYCFTLPKMLTLAMVLVLG